jgi:1-aminocyclopropane-1-carboxylate deaminase/D-cysteine desulfhydrase-like pyridoxal-dependent ACC family enzyme
MDMNAEAGGSNRVGALGYLYCAQELMQQADDMGLRIDRLCRRLRPADAGHDR